MGKIEIIVKGYKCERCSHQWIPRGNKNGDEPLVCPKCKSPYFNRPRREKEERLIE